MGKEKKKKIHIANWTALQFFMSQENHSKTVAQLPIACHLHPLRVTDMDEYETCKFPSRMNPAGNKLTDKSLDIGLLRRTTLPSTIIGTTATVNTISLQREMGHRVAGNIYLHHVVQKSTIAASGSSETSIKYPA